MKLQKSKYLERSIARITKKYNSSKKNLTLILKKGNHITSIWITPDGVVDKLNGEFHDEETEVNYKLSNIKCKD